MIDFDKNPEEPYLAVLCAVHLPEVSELEFRESVDELAQLATTLGLKVVGEITQKRASFDAAAYLGPGKLADLATLVSSHPEHTLILVDHEISPSQARHLEELTQSAGVLDRTAVILDIFHRHAHSRQAKLQVEMVRLAYLAPRLRETDHSYDQQRGFIGAKGTGEKKIDLDRRKIRDRIAELRQELKGIAKEREVQSHRRQGLRRVAICGYTNAGKSTLFAALTQKEAYIADKLFATLDTTVRTLQPEPDLRILVSDTIGFIRNLPTKLIESFKSTLDETLEAGLILHVVDCSDPAFERQMKATNEVLKEIGAGEISQFVIFNKADKISDTSQMIEVQKEFPHSIVMSAYRTKDVETLRQEIVRFFDQQLLAMEVLIPYNHQEARSLIFSHSKVVEERFLEEGVLFRIQAEPIWVEKIKKLGIAHEKTD